MKMKIKTCWLSKLFVCLEMVPEHKCRGENNVSFILKRTRKGADNTD